MDTVRCDICNEYEGSERQVTSHKIHCSKRNEDSQKTREENRTERIPFGSPKQRLNVPDDDENFHYRRFNDGWAKEPNRIQRAKQAGYEIVDGDSMVVGTNDDGTPITGVLMKQPMEFFKADQKEKQKEPDRIDKAIRGGTLEQQAGDRRYIPKGIEIHSNTSIKP